MKKKDIEVLGGLLNLFCAIGESEKNIKAFFDSYRALVAKFELAPILLFNEADAIIGIRKQGADNAVKKMENTLQISFCKRWRLLTAF